MKEELVYLLQLFHNHSAIVADENHQGTIKTSSDPLHIHGGPITRARAKNMQAT